MTAFPLIPGQPFQVPRSQRKLEIPGGQEEGVHYLDLPENVVNHSVVAFALAP